ncbi:MAG: stage II sporulation protein P [Oscillospiraceae bacterium]|nr:stage II sporulation protein P [Oscillospiraceae bacterium]
MEQKVLRAGTFAVVCALVLRLVGAVNWNVVLPKDTTAWILFLQTGRVIRPVNIQFAPQSTEPTEETVPDTTQPPTVDKPVFSETDAGNIKINSGFSYTADLPALIQKPLEWDLTGDAPTVLILHSHGSESFAPTGEYTESSPYHTLDNGYNMVSIGAHLAELLEAGGICVVQDSTLHDNPSYNASYGNSRAAAQDYLEKYPSIRLVLDLHRDSIADADGNQVAQTVFSEGSSLAPLMFVVGTDYGGLSHPQWQENLALALKLQTQLESICPGICRNINLRTQRFNQDLSPGALLVEVGSSGNQRGEALRAAEVLAEGILSLAHGSG